jgi:hypothetical protein
MATRQTKPAAHGAERIAHKGAATPTQVPTPTSSPAADMPPGTKATIALTVRLEPERSRRLVAYAAGFVPRKTHQDILIEALEAYLDRVWSDGLTSARLHVKTASERRADAYRARHLEERHHRECAGGGGVSHG